MNLAPGIRTALTGNSPITQLLGKYERQPSIHTRRPAPKGAQYPMIMISEDVALGNQDILRKQRPVIVRDVAIYGQQDDHFRDVEAIGYLVRQLFHRKKFSMGPPEGWRVIDIVASGPIRAPVSDATLCGRIVTLTVRLQPTAS